MTGNEKSGGQWRSAGALLALLLGISLVGGRSAAAQAPALRLVPPAVLTAGEINCAADFGAPPNQFIDAAGKQQGVNPDIMAQVAKELNVQLKWTNLPFGSQIAGLQGKRFDAMCGSTIVNPDRLRAMYMIPYIRWGRVMMSRADEPSPLTCAPTDYDACIQQLAGKTGLTGTGSIEHTDLKQWSDEFVKQGKPPIKIQGFENQGQAAAALARGVGTISYHEDPQVVFFMGQFPNRFKILFQGYKLSPVSLAVRREPDAIPLADALVLGLQKTKANGSYAEILKKWNLTPVDSFDYQK